MTLSKNIIVAFLVCLLLAGMQAQAAEQFYVNNQPVDANTYKGSLLVQEGFAALKANDNVTALDKFHQAVLLAPNLANAHHDMAVALARLNRVNEAIPEIQKAIELGDDNEGSLITLAGFYQSSGQIDLAVNAYNQYLSRFPKNQQVPHIKALVKSLIKENNKIGQVVATTQANGGTVDNNRSASDYLFLVSQDNNLSWSLADMPINVYIEQGDGVDGFQSQYADVLRQAFADWSIASKGKISFAFVDKAKEAQIRCLWTDNARDLDNPSEQGQANTWTKNGRIVKGKITLLTVPWSSNLPFGDNFLRNICLHEIGHVLGLLGHSDNPADVMFMSISNSQVHRDLSNRDINTICRLYSIN